VELLKAHDRLHLGKLHEAAQNLRNPTRFCMEEEITREFALAPGRSADTDGNA
jgi:hypothetical protein